MREFALHIDGQFTESSQEKKIDSINPSEGARFGGCKRSGVGREFGIEGLREYMETKHLHIDELGSRDKRFWYNTVIAV
jgi:hypothetical protein